MDELDFAGPNAEYFQQLLLELGDPFSLPDLPEDQAGPSTAITGQKRTRESNEEEADDANEDQPTTATGYKLSAEAARNKANREKQRRERLNERFHDLSSVLYPSGNVKSDRVAILSDAMRLLNHLKQENSQLRELNKYLQDRVVKSESASSYQVFQWHLSQQANLLRQYQAGKEGANGASTSQGVTPGGVEGKDGGSSEAAAAAAVAVAPPPSRPASRAIKDKEIVNGKPNVSSTTNPATLPAPLPSASSSLLPAAAPAAWAGGLFPPPSALPPVAPFPFSSPLLSHALAMMAGQDPTAVAATGGGGAGGGGVGGGGAVPPPPPAVTEPVLRPPAA